MNPWFILFLSCCICALIKLIFSTIFPSKKSTLSLPPGPPSIPIIGNLFWLYRSFSDIEQILRELTAKYGPIITLSIGSKKVIFVASPSLTHQALVQNGVIFANRPKATVADKLMNSNQHDINSCFYGPTWRLLRRNITSEIFHPSRVKSYSHARRRVLENLIKGLRSCSKSGEAVAVMDHFRYAMFCLLALMCFGDNLEEEQIKQVEDVHRQLLANLPSFDALDFWPRVGKILLRKTWQQLFQLLDYRKQVLGNMISERRKLKGKNMSKEEEQIVCYVDTLLDLELPDKRKLDEDELVSLCSEFFAAGTDTTSTALEWIMANCVKYPEIQERLYTEIKEVVGGEAEEVREDDLHDMKYLKAVIMEGLRRHPPGHFVLPHTVTQDTELGGYMIPKDVSINFMTAEMARDPKVWDDPMAFKPERFLDSVEGGIDVDITGTKDIKMLPFGGGRRICPGMSLAMHHLEYFVANMILHFKWIPVGEVDLSEKREFTVVMKSPLQAHIISRSER